MLLRVCVTVCVCVLPQLNLPELALLRFVVLDDFCIGDDFIGQYALPLDCMQAGFRHVPLLTAEGEELPHARLLVHVAMTERRGGGKAHKRGLSVRMGRRSRHYMQLQELGLRVLDDIFKMANQPLREATDLRENMQVENETVRKPTVLVSRGAERHRVRGVTIGGAAGAAAPRARGSWGPVAGGFFVAKKNICAGGGGVVVAAAVSDIP